MKVLLLGDINSKHLQRWVYGLEQLGVEIMVFSFLPDRGKQTDILYHSLIKEENRISPILQRNIFSAKHIVKNIIEEFNPNIVHAHYASSYGKLMRSVNFHPSILSVWGSDIYSFPKKNFLFRSILEKNLNASDLIQSTSNDMKRETQLYTKKEIQVLPFGIDTKRFTPQNLKPKSDKIILGIVKSLLPIYAIDHAIKAIALLNNPDIVLTIIGEGPMKHELIELSEELKIKDQIYFLGSMPNEIIQNEYVKFDIFLNVSHTESFGVSVLEASACGVPVIVHNKAGMTEVVVHERTGLLITDNSPQTICDNIICLLSNVELMSVMRMEGPKFVKEKYNLSNCLQQQVDIYNGLI